ncbi:vWA domain-containing protein [Nocardia jejuensis]|uniref:vWA domain-containing protein n=1 Tax=Nocardia jejuensis TaxID=328049 RepID=UPI0008297E98|nr:VWA domain-containing protein [Nocardia jejuensis]
MTALAKGQNGPLAVDDVVISLRIGAPADLSALLVTERGTVRSDADFVFFNQPTGPGVQLRPAAGSRSAVLAVALRAVPADIAQIRAVIALDDPGSTFGAGAAPIAHVSDAAGNPLYEYAVEGLSSESIVIALELYRRNSEWKVRAVGQGYAGGFAALVTDHGVSVEDEPAAFSPPQPDSAVRHAAPQQQDSPVRSVAGEEKLSLVKREKLNLRKQEVAKVLLTKGASGVRARVLLVIDKTGSMAREYSNGVVHRVVERMVPVAIQLDDDGELEPYLYARGYAKLPNVTVAEVDAWCATYIHLSGTHAGIDYGKLGASNDELPIIGHILQASASSTLPVLVLFFTDGGFSKKAQIAALMRDASRLPVFWQFIGLGKNKFGMLHELDTLSGRVVDNAGFFAVPDIDRLSDAELYAKLLEEFPAWLRAAKDAQIVR